MNNNIHLCAGCCETTSTNLDDFSCFSLTLDLQSLGCKVEDIVIKWNLKEVRNINWKIQKYSFPKIGMVSGKDFDCPQSFNQGLLLSNDQGTLLFDPPLGTTWSDTDMILGVYLTLHYCML